MAIFCITSSNPTFQKLLAESKKQPLEFEMMVSKWMTESGIHNRYPTLQELGITAMESAKPGVAELFDSTPELANAVYEALGFNPNEFSLVLKKQEENPEGIMLGEYDIIYKDAVIGNVFLPIGFKNYTIKGIGFKEQYLNKGLGKAFYKWLGNKADIENATLNSDFDNTSESAKRVWESLKKENLAVDTQMGYKFSPKNLKQQAQQLYSQYLDSIFPDSKVKDIVYHSGSINKNDKFDRLKIGAYSKLDMFYFTSSKYFEKLDTLLDFYKHYFKNYVLEDYFEEVVASNSIQDIISLAEKILGKNNLTIKNNIENSENDYKKHSGKFYGGWFDSIYESKNLLPAILNVKNPITSNVENGYIKNPNTGIKNVGKYPASTYITNKEYDSYFISDHDIGVKNPEQIHILGSKNNIDGFKEFVDKLATSKLASTAKKSDEDIIEELVQENKLERKCQ